MRAVPLGDRTSRSKSGGDPHVAGDSTLAFGGDLFGAVAAREQRDENLVVSPLSVAIALAMLEPGVVGEPQQRLRALLRIDDENAYQTSMAALQDSLETRVAEGASPGEKPGEITLHIADAAYLQNGYPFHRTYIDTITSRYGSVLFGVDFTANPDAVAHDINRFVAEHTAGRITNIVPDGALTRDTVLALVNALYMKASWLQPFTPSATAPASFTKLDGSPVTAQMMHGLSSWSQRGDGWVAAGKAYVGGLSVQFVLPDAGRFDDVAGRMSSVFDGVGQDAAEGAPLVVPQLETRSQVSLREPLGDLGLGALYEPGNLLGIADDHRLVVDKVLHQTYLKMDEEGTEAAAATVVTARATMGGGPEPVPVVLDRPFLFRIVDQQTGATLFLGRVMDPTLR